MGRSKSFYNFNDLVDFAVDDSSTHTERVLSIQRLMFYMQDTDEKMSDRNMKKLGEFALGRGSARNASYAQPFAIHILGFYLVRERAGASHWAVKYLTKIMDVYAPWHPAHNLAKHWLSIIQFGGV